MQKNQQKRHSLELESERTQNKHMQHQKRNSVQTPFEDAIFLEDSRRQDIEDFDSPGKESKDFSEVDPNQPMEDLMNDVNQKADQTMIRKVFDFSKDTKNSRKVSVIIFCFL